MEILNIFSADSKFDIHKHRGSVKVRMRKHLALSIEADSFPSWYYYTKVIRNFQFSKVPSHLDIHLDAPKVLTNFSG